MANDATNKFRKMKKILLLLLLPVMGWAQVNCIALQIPISQRLATPSTPTPAGYSKNVQIYVETTNDIYQYCNSDTAQVRLFVQARFEEWRKLYLADSIIISLDSIGYWTTPEPYPLTSSTATLTAFGARMDSLKPTADCYHLISITPNNLGGVSYVGGVGLRNLYSVSFSNIYVPYLPFPNYSWTVEVQSHECGHVLGSQHTQWCGWLWPDGTTHPIDTCWNNEGACWAGTKYPLQHGTVMSYCHLLGAIDFTYGFGTLPRNAIKQCIWDAYNAGLLKNPNGFVTPCTPPPITDTITTTNSIFIQWQSNGTKYKFHYKKAGVGIWSNTMTITTNSTTITGLLSNATYAVQVKSFCNGTWTLFNNPVYKIKTK